ncbi:fumarylacetoacetate hydrolase family protein [Paeniglutamicibacter gangotriensis]|uniref:Fumarylacetoacetate hydrolase family protein n=1 Tax=Paeniglutamicibacter gangotriensis TaxID=254787 RepID=A0A5B0EFB6_9MICC|nr:fumarylacetoacetate hydrolase family protein [Paeniglutamicibacter gangotriensis]KAA0976049.1 fumarylacetoacetate hydrolase family protein [Paeniglutamicibacter gangotriensis]
MKLATLRRRSASADTFAAVITEESFAELEGFADVGAFLAADVQSRTAALGAAAGSATPLAEADYAPLILNPAKIFCIGLNYRNHIAEVGKEEPKFPTVFTKFASSLTGAHDDIEIPSEDHRIDWEGELAVIIGEPGRRITESDAPKHIAGYAVSNDVSMRGYQGRTTEWTQGKCWDAASPLGPWLVSAEDFAAGAKITTRVNGEVVQEDSTADLVFSPAALVAYLSVFNELRPGDVILTGTPAGVALGRRNEAGRHPWLKAGDVLETSIESLGSSRNTFN